mmetsp:Transcript_24659/g.52124  ORF Transcript_24659/g.52124 Transcript_24659/m.52124 type:complete len:108 (-) Transcript_24659:807-1130(-)
MIRVVHSFIHHLYLLLPGEYALFPFWIPIKEPLPVKAFSFRIAIRCVSKKHCLHKRTGSSSSSDGKTLQSRQPPDVCATRKWRPAVSYLSLSACESLKMHTWQPSLS